ELAAQDQHSSQVLQGDGETQLAHEVRAAFGRLERGAGDEEEPRTQETDGEDGADEAEGIELDRPERQASENAGRGLGQSVDGVEDVEDGPDQRDAADDRRHPTGYSSPGGNEG